MKHQENAHVYSAGVVPAMWVFDTFPIITKFSFVLY